VELGNYLADTFHAVFIPFFAHVNVRLVEWRSNFYSGVNNNYILAFPFTFQNTVDFLLRVKKSFKFFE
jgi:hypothetical protein